jgi:hypothetical protein
MERCSPNPTSASITRRSHSSTERSKRGRETEAYRRTKNTTNEARRRDQKTHRRGQRRASVGYQSQPQSSETESTETALAHQIGDHHGLLGKQLVLPPLFTGFWGLHQTSMPSQVHRWRCFYRRLHWRNALPQGVSASEAATLNNDGGPSPPIITLQLLL